MNGDRIPISVRKKLDTKQAYYAYVNRRYTAVLAQIKNGKMEEVKKYLNDTITVLNSSDRIVNTNHPAIDALIQSKLDKCDEKNIKTDFKYFYNEEILVNEIELSVILGNLLDNAIEANEKIQSEKYINLLISVQNSEINITMENPCEQSNEDLKTTKRDRHSHGYGIKSITAIAEKYGGTARFTQSNNTFISYITMLNKE